MHIQNILIQTKTKRHRRSVKVLFQDSSQFQRFTKNILIVDFQPIKRPRCCRFREAMQESRTEKFIVHRYCCVLFIPLALGMEARHETVIQVHTAVPLKTSLDLVLGLPKCLDHEPQFAILFPSEPNLVSHQIFRPTRAKE